MVNFVPAVASYFCLALPAAFTQPGARIFSRAQYGIESATSCALFSFGSVSADVIYGWSPRGCSAAAQANVPETNGALLGKLEAVNTRGQLSYIFHVRGKLLDL